MKKLMFVAAALAAGVVAYGLESANTVGYDTVAINSVSRYSGGATFVPVGGGDTITLGDFIAIDMDPDSDYIQILDTSDTSVLNRYVYFSKELADALNEDENTTEYTALIGWWEADEVGDTSRDAAQLPVGQGWLLANGSGSDIKFQYNGEVPMETTQVETLGVARPFIANILPRAVTLGEIVIDEFDPDSDYLQELDTSDTSVINRYTYFPQALADDLNADENTDEYDALVGWWVTDEVGEEGSECNNVSVPTGKAFLGACGSGASWVVKFPPAVVPQN